MTKTQITITVEGEHLSYLRTLAKDEFEGNNSMAIRKIINDHQEMTAEVDE